MNHPHEHVHWSQKYLTDEELKNFSKLCLWKGYSAIALEWALIFLSIFVGSQSKMLLSRLLVVIFVATRQHALFILSHDAVHFRIHPKPYVNDLISDVFLCWPRFSATALGRKVHGKHHTHLGTKEDGNIKLWGTHDDQGNQTSEWSYPKTKIGLVQKLSWRSCGITGTSWILAYARTISHMFGENVSLELSIFFFAKAFALIYFKIIWLYLTFWILPLISFNVGIHYLRIAFEHSGIRKVQDKPESSWTRTTIVGFPMSFLFMPYYIGYHVAHHFYPSIPFYNLKAADAAMRKSKDFCQTYHTTVGFWAGISELTSPLL